MFFFFFSLCFDFVCCFTTEGFITRRRFDVGMV